jgi:hypothetical protein
MRRKVTLFNNKLSTDFLKCPLLRRTRVNYRLLVSDCGVFPAFTAAGACHSPYIHDQSKGLSRNNCYKSNMLLYPSFRQGMPESRLQGRTDSTHPKKTSCPGRWHPCRSDASHSCELDAGNAQRRSDREREASEQQGRCRPAQDARILVAGSSRDGCFQSMPA